MARRKKLFQEVDAEEVNEAPVVLEAPEEKEFPDDFQNLIDEFGPQFYIIIERYNDDGMPEIVGKFSSDSFDQFAIGEKYGGGRFRFTIRNDHGAYVRRFVRTYAKPLIKPEHFAKPDESSKQMIELMREQLKSTQDEQKSTASALVNMMSKVMETTIAVTSRPQAGANNNMDDILKIITMLGLNKQTNPMDNISSVMDLFKNGLEMGKTMNSFNSDSKPEDVVLMKLAEGLMPMLSKLGQHRAQQAPQGPERISPGATPRTDIIDPGKSMETINIPVINDAGIPKSSTQGAPMYSTETEKIVIETLKNNLSGLLNAGKFNMNPASIADIITEKLDDNSSSRLLDYYTNPENFERTLQFIPEFVPVKDWLRKVLEEIFKCYQPEEPITPAPAPIIGGGTAQGV